MINKVSVRPLLLASFVMVALIPIIINSYSVYRESWRNAWREIQEKHQLLAENLASPISIYFENHKEMLNLVAQKLEPEIINNEKILKEILQTSLFEIAGYNALLLIDRNGKLVYCINRLGDVQKSLDVSTTSFFKTVHEKKNSISGVMKSPISTRPAIFLTSRISQEQDLVLVASLSLETIEKLRKQIRFGKKGHSAIVDNTGKVVAHPNPEWMTSMRDLSHLSVVKHMLNRETGVTEFYSPFIKQVMVAGYTHIPSLGWGVMVPQPKMEVTSQVNRIVIHNFIWGMISLLLAIIAAIVLGRIITKPINELAGNASNMLINNFKTYLPIIENGPKEIVQMAKALQAAVLELIHSRTEHEDLNKSLKVRVGHATKELLQANKRLQYLAKSDHLTKLSNRRHFESCFTSTLEKRGKDNKSCVLLLLDVDKFKRVNDQYGHNAGDKVLSHIATVIQAKVRESDLVARYGGDEFVALMNSDKEVAVQRANEVKHEISNHVFYHERTSFHITVSIGLLYLDSIDQNVEKSHLFKQVDDAMYAAKNQGRNKIVEVVA